MRTILVTLSALLVLAACGGDVTTATTSSAGAELTGRPVAPGETDPTTSPSGPPADAVWVSPDGQDSASGTEGAPVATLERGLELVAPGGTIVLAEGIHTGGHMLEGVADITITGVAGAVIEGGGVEPLGIFCSECRNVTIENLEVRGFTDVGVGADLGTDITLRGLEVHRNGTAVQLIDWELEGYGIHVDGSADVLIEGNDVHDNGPDPPDPPDRILGTGINTFGNTAVVIRGNRSHHNRGGGILVEDSWDVVVEGNEVTNNDLDASAQEWWDGGLWVDGGGRVAVRDNVFRDNLGPGLEISDEDDQDPTGYVLERNVSTGNYFGIFIWNFGTGELPPLDVLRLDANDFEGNSRRDIWLVP